MAGRIAIFGSRVFLSTSWNDANKLTGMPFKERIVMPAQRKVMRTVNLAFVDLRGDRSPLPGKDYELVDATSEAVGALPIPPSDFKSLSLQLLNLYIEDLPDFTHKNEGLLKLNSETRTYKDKSNKEELTYSVEFSVRDRNYAPGFLQRDVFKHVLIQNTLNLSFNLVELDKDLAEVYTKVAGVVNDSGLSSIDALNTIPYLKVAAKLFGGLIKVFGKNADDLVWSEAPSLDLSPAPGGAFLRTGIYLLYEMKSIHPTKSSRNKEGIKIKVKDLLYSDGEIRHKDDPQFPLSNHLMFNIRIETAAKEDGVS
jgi:hypothetical protein